MAETEQAFEGWAVLELMGHRRLAGYVSEQEFAGAAFVRIDVPNGEGEAVATQLYSASAVYCITPTTEDIARAISRRNQPTPVQRWELPAPEAVEREAQAAVWASAGDDDEDDDFVPD